MIKLFTCMSLLIASLAHSIIYDVDHFDSLCSAIDKDTLIILDIDNTLIRPVQQLGSDQWFHSRIDHYKRIGYESQEALDEALSEWMAVQNVSKMCLVEEGTDQIIKDLQERGYRVMGLTTRGLGLSNCTIRQLNKLNIDLRKTALSQEEIFFMNGQGVLYRDGILFTSGTHKGKAFLKLIDKLSYTPKSMVFINDKYDNIRQLEVSCEERNYPFQGLRYGFLDSWVKQLDESVTNIQFEHFGHILSDEAARSLLHIFDEAK